MARSRAFSVSYSSRTTLFPKLLCISPGRVKDALSPGCKNSGINCEPKAKQTSLIHHAGFRHTFRSFRYFSSARQQGVPERQSSDFCQAPCGKSRLKLPGDGYPNFHCSSGNVLRPKSLTIFLIWPPSRTGNFPFSYSYRDPSYTAGYGIHWKPDWLSFPGKGAYPTYTRTLAAPPAGIPGLFSSPEERLLLRRRILCLYLLPRATHMHRRLTHGRLTRPVQVGGSPGLAPLGRTLVKVSFHCFPAAPDLPTREPAIVNSGVSQTPNYVH